MAAATGRMVAADIMAFAGVDPEQALAAVRDGGDGFEVPTPAPDPSTPFSLPTPNTTRERPRGVLRRAAQRLRGTGQSRDRSS